MKQQTNSFNTFTQWVNSSISLKMATIGFLTLILLIPLALITDVIHERSIRKQEVVNEISQSWSGAQIVKGPIITIPYETSTTYKDDNGRDQKNYHRQLLQILPESLDISGPIQHEFRKRGIYEVTLYNSAINLKGDFIIPAFDILNLEQVLWDEAFITVGVSHMKGIQDEIRLIMDDVPLSIEPGSRIAKTVISGFTAEITSLTEENIGQPLPFELDLNLKGSKQLHFVPLGKVTNVHLSSTWPDPSFNGEFLPTNHQISDEGFEANWKVLHLNRNFPQHWVNESHNYSTMMDDAAFGVQLFNSIDDYQVITRASKYGLMTIAITFLVFFLIEIMGKKRIHPMQYILVGLALVLFYILLVAITEHGGFMMAYLIAASAIILMIFGYSFTVFKDKKLSFGLLLVLVAAYAFILVTLQLVDYALLIGSVGMTIILALTMYLTRKINWFNIGSSMQSDLAPQTHA